MAFRSTTATMSWFEKAKTVLIEALDIQDDEGKSSPEKENTGGSDTRSGHDLTAGSGSGGGGVLPSSSSAASIATPPSDTPTFFDNPHANEMVTIPPRASDTTTTPTSGTASSALYAKRQSATSDSVDLLSSPTSPISPTGGGAELPVAVVKRPSESSLELITATTASELEMSPDTEPSLPDSIVIIASNETSDNAEGDGEDDDDERHMEDHLNGISQSIIQ